MRERCDRIVAVVHRLRHAARNGEIMHERLFDHLPRGVLAHEIHLLARSDLFVHRGINVAVGMAGKHDGLFPTGHVRTDALAQNGRAEHRAVENAADRAVGTFPHFFKAVFLHALQVGRDRGAFYGYTVFFRGKRALLRHLVVGPIAVFKPQIIIFRFQLDVRFDQDFFDLFPKDTGHFVAVHLHERRFHFNLQASTSLCFLALIISFFQRRLQLFAPEKTAVFKIPEQTVVFSSRRERMASSTSSHKNARACVSFSPNR